MYSIKELQLMIASIQRLELFSKIRGTEKFTNEYISKHLLLDLLENQSLSLYFKMCQEVYENGFATCMKNGRLTRTIIRCKKEEILLLKNLILSESRVRKVDRILND